MSFDSQLDDQLRDVPLPGGLVARLKAALAPTDEQLDVRLREVEVPAALLASLRAIPDDQRVDQKLCAVVVPFELVWRARRDSWRTVARRVLRRAAELAVALVLFLCVSIALTAATGAIVATVYPHALPPDEPPFIVASNAPLKVDAQFAEASIPIAIMPPPVVEENQPVAVAVTSSSRTALEVEPPELPLPWTAGPVAQWFASLERGANPLDNVVLLKWGILGYPQFGEEVTPALESPQLPQAAGIELPAVRGYDRGLAIRRGVFPPLSPAAHTSLARFALPLSTQIDSYDRIRWLARQGRWPAASLVRTEDFLAAMDYRFPPARSGELAIRTAAGPSVFGPAGTALVQIAAVAGELPRQETEARHLILAIDISASMLRGHRLDLVQRGVNRLLDHLGPRDRLSLVIFHEAVECEVECATLADREDIRRLLAELRPSRGTDLAEGLQRAVALAGSQNSRPDDAAQIVLITDSHVAIPPQGLAAITQMLKEAVAGGVRMQVLDVGDQPDVDETLTVWASLMRGDVRRPSSADQAGWLLVEALYGQSPVVASESRLSVRFNTQAVAAYRLIGHEANAMAAIRPASQSAELRAGEAATTLLEIWFQPNEVNDVGEVELTWRDPVTGVMHQRSQRISRLQFAPTWEQAPLSLQQAALAAETAEVLRGSRTALRELGLIPQGKGNVEGLEEMAARVHPGLAERPDFRNWTRLVQELARIRAP